MIRCWLFQFSAGQALDAGRAPTPAQARHLAECAACRRHYETQTRLVTRLEPAALEPESPAFLHGKIMARLRELEQPASPAQPFKISHLFAGAALVILLGAALLPRLANRKSELTAPPREHSALRQMETARLDILGTSKVLSQPLEMEMQALASDARSALALVAHNFLPGDLSGATQ